MELRAIEGLKTRKGKKNARMLIKAGYRPSELKFDIGPDGEERIAIEDNASLRLLRQMSKEEIIDSLIELVEAGFLKINTDINKLPALNR